jgi:hypothetical protein
MPSSTRHTPVRSIPSPFSNVPHVQTIVSKYLSQKIDIHQSPLYVLVYKHQFSVAQPASHVYEHASGRVGDILWIVILEVLRPMHCLALVSVER